jgi:hypothetical protein
MAILKLSKAPKHVLARDVAGAIAADSATINTTNYPLTNGVDPDGAAKIAVYWDATDTAPGDWLTLELLEQHGPTVGETTGGWQRAGRVYKVPPKTKMIFDGGGNNALFVRVEAINIAIATDLKIYATRHDVP